MDHSFDNERQRSFLKNYQTLNNDCYHHKYSHYKFHDSFKIQASSYIVLTLFFTLFPFMIPDNWSYIPLILNNFFDFGWQYLVQSFSIVSMIFIAFLNKEKPKSYAYPYNLIEKYFFYIFYPTHLALLAVLRGLYL